MSAICEKDVTICPKCWIKETVLGNATHFMINTKFVFTKCYMLVTSPGANKWKGGQSNVSNFRSYGTEHFLTNLSATNTKFYTNPPGILQSKTFFLYAVELYLSGIIGTASHPDMQKIRIIGFFCQNRLHFTVCSFAVTIYSRYLRLRGLR